MRRLLTVVLSAVLLLAACGDDTDDPEPPDDAVTTDPPEPAWRSCENREEGYSIEHPAEWRTNDGEVMAPCSLFDPEPIEIEPATEIPLDIAVAVTVDAVRAEDVWIEGPFEEELSRATATVDGRDAVRLEIEADGDGFLPAGMRATRWIVDLDDRTLIARTHDTGEPPYAEAVEVLDDMVETLVFDDVSDPTTTTTAPDDEGPDPIGEPGTEAVESEDFPGGFGDTALLIDVREARQDGFHRIVLEFEGDAVPSYRVTYIDPPARRPGSGFEVEVEGSDLLELRLEPAARVDLADPDAAPTYEGPERIPLEGPGPARELVFVGDFEANMAWVVGIDGEADFGAVFLEDPLRLVVDVVDR